MRFVEIWWVSKIGASLKGLLCGIAVLVSLWHCKSNADLVLTVTENVGGGVTLQASGSFDFSDPSFMWDFDAQRTSSGTLYFSSAELYMDPVSPPMNAEHYSGTYVYSSPVVGGGTIIYDSLNEGSHGNLVNMDSFGFYLLGSHAGFDNSDTFSGVAQFNFSLIDNDGTLSQYTEGVFWRSSAGPNAQTAMLQFSSIPEPGATGLAIGAVCCAAIRRRRR